jgi:hypothetical protein
MNIIDIILKDTLLLVTLIISIFSLILILVLAAYYKKIKEQQMISQIISSSEKQESELPKKKKDSEEIVRPNVPEQKISQQDVDIFIAQLNEVTKQINLVNNHIKEMSNIIKSLQTKPISENMISEEVLTKLVNALNQLETQISSFQKLNQTTVSSIEEINKKIDNLVKLLSTILQQ